MVRHPRFIIGVLLVSILPAFSKQASAAMITFEFGGVVNTVNDPYGFLEGKVQIGDSFSGSYTFDSDTPDSYPDDPELGSYTQTNAFMAIAIGEMLISATPEANNSVATGNYRFGVDAYSLFCGGYYVSGLYIVESGIHLRDNTGTAFDSDALPTNPPNLGKFQDRILFIEGGYDGVTNFDFDIKGTVTSLTPEPSSLIVMLVSGFLIGHRRQRM